MKTSDVNKCDCTHTQACKICAKSKDIDWNLIEPPERDPKMNDGSYYQIGCVDIKKDLWANINCHNLIDPKTCGRELSCIKCKNFKDNYVRERYPKQQPKASQVEGMTAESIIEILYKHSIGASIDTVKMNVMTDFKAIANEILLLESQPKTASDDLIQYVTNLLYTAHGMGEASEGVHTPIFDKWVEEQTELLSLYASQQRVDIRGELIKFFNHYWTNHSKYRFMNVEVIVDEYLSTRKDIKP